MRWASSAVDSAAPKVDAPSLSTKLAAVGRKSEKLQTQAVANSWTPRHSTLLAVF